MKKLWKVLKVMLWVMGCLGIALIVFHSAATFFLGRRVEAQVRALKAQHQPLTLEDLVEPALADDENAAVPYRRAAALLARRKADLELFDEATAQDVIPAKWWPAARTAVSRNADAIELVREATRRPRMRYNINTRGDIADFSGQLLPHLAEVRRLVRFLGAAAVVAARDGDTGRAVEMMEMQATLAERAPERAGLIGGLVEYACVSIVSRTVELALNEATPNDVQARRLYEALGRIDPVAAHRDALTGERAWMLTGLQQLLPDDGGRYILKPWMYSEQLTMLRLLDREITSTSSYRETIRDPRSTPKPPFYAFLSKTTAPMLPKLRQQRDAALANVRGCQTALALSAYRARHGTYPESLTALAQYPGWKLGDDPFAEGPFVYRREGAGYLLYSVGPNLNDDKGVRVKRGSGKTPDDIVWRVKQ